MTRRQIIAENLSRRQAALLKVAGNRRLERRAGHARTFDDLVEMGMISRAGKLTIEGGRTIRVINRLEKTNVRK